MVEGNVAVQTKINDSSRYVSAITVKSIIILMRYPALGCPGNSVTFLSSVWFMNHSTSYFLNTDKAHVFEIFMFTKIVYPLGYLNILSHTALFKKVGMLFVAENTAINSWTRHDIRVFCLFINVLLQTMIMSHHRLGRGLRPKVNQTLAWRLKSQETSWSLLGPGGTILTQYYVWEKRDCV